MEEKLKLDNKGFSLIELIISIAISVVIMGAAFVFVMIGTKNYNNANKTTNVQHEMSFVNNMLGEAIKSGDNDTAIIRKLSSGDQILYLGDKTTTGQNKKVFYYSKADKVLYVYESRTSSITSLSNLDVYTPDSDKSDHVVSKYVDSFDVTWASSDGSGEPITSEYESGIIATDRRSNLVRVKVGIKLKDKADKTEVIYEIRN